jgi:hypothetical protein
MKTSAIAAILFALVSLALSGCESVTESSETSHSETHGESGHVAHKILVTSPVRMDVINTEEYVCQIHSCQHIEVRALEGGYLDEIRVQEGQAVKKGELMFKILPTVYQAKLDSELAEANRIQIELNNAEMLLKKNYVSPQEIALKKAELAKAGDDKLVGELMVDPQFLGDLKEGAIIEFTEKDVVDWAFLRGEELIGHYTTRVSLPRMDPVQAEGLRSMFGENPT